MFRRSRCSSAQAKEANKRFVPIAKKLDGDIVGQDQPRARRSGGEERRSSELLRPALATRSNGAVIRIGSLAAQVIGFSECRRRRHVRGSRCRRTTYCTGRSFKPVQERDRLGRVYDETDGRARRTERCRAHASMPASRTLSNRRSRQGVKNAQAKSGMAIAMDPKTGEILGLANYPTFDPNTINGRVGREHRNQAIQSVYSPGSTFKIVTYGSALERHLFKPDDMIDAGNGSITVAGPRVQRSPHGSDDILRGSRTFEQHLRDQDRIECRAR